MESQYDNSAGNKIGTNEEIKFSSLFKLQNEYEEMKKLTKLRNVWVIWEEVQPLDGATGKLRSQQDYLDSLHEIAEFDNMISFWQLWNKLQHANPNNCFAYYDDKKHVLCQKLYIYHQINVIALN